MSAPSISRRQAWVLAARPRTLPAAMAPVIVGTALAAGRDAFAPLPVIAALASALLIQIGTNLANDYFDFVRGVDVSGRKGPLRVAQSGLIPLPALRWGIALTLAAAALTGAYLIAVGGWPVVAIGVASLLAALAYSGGPLPLSSHGLGDLFAFVFFGLIGVAGTYYVQTLAIDGWVLLVGVAIGAWTTNILVVNNLRDMETDRRVGKRSLAVIIGARATRVEYMALLAVAYAVPAVMWLAGPWSAWVLLPWLSAPLVRRPLSILLRTTDGPPLNRTLAETARLDLIYSALLAGGLVLDRIDEMLGTVL